MNPNKTLIFAERRSNRLNTRWLIWVSTGPNVLTVGFADCQSNRVGLLLCLVELDEARAIVMSNNFSFLPQLFSKFSNKISFKVRLFLGKYIYLFFFLFFLLGFVYCFQHLFS